MLGSVLFASLLAMPLRIEPGAEPGEVKVVARLTNRSAGPLAQKDGERVLRLALIAEAGDGVLAVFGKYEQRGELLIFTPRFRLAAGERYCATLTLDSQRRVTTEFAIPAAPAAKATTVAAVYPSADELPANLLKFYIHFSRPMREGPAVFDRIQLLDKNGEVVEDPWRRTELWNEDATRLTLWIHPGRTKEGVNLRDEIGPVLEPDRTYSLVIGSKVLDAEGRPLGTAFKKTFRTSAAVRSAIDMKEWKLRVPAPDSNEPLVVSFARPLDRALLGRSLSVVGANGIAIAGTVSVGERERSWSFRPDRAWETGTFTLIADERLEDLAGNTPLRPFDLNLKLPPKADTPRSRSFRIGS